MAELLVFHSGNPSWMTCKKAIGIAEEMKKKYGNKLEVKINTTDSAEAMLYNFKSSTNVIFQKELVPIEIATDSKKMEVFLSQKIWKPLSAEGTFFEGPGKGRDQQSRQGQLAGVPKMDEADVPR